MGWALARRGLLPYVGSWAHTLPGMAYVHALAILLFGNTALGFRVLDVLVHLGSAMLLFSVGRRFIGELGAFVAATLLTLYYVSEGFWLAGQPDGFAVFFILLATALYLLRTGSHISLFAAGFAIAFAGMIRPTYFLFAASLFIIVLLERRSWIALVSGGVVLVMAMLAPYIFIRGGLYQVYEAAIGFNLDVYGGVRTNYRLLNLLLHPLVVVAIAGLLCFLVTRWRKKDYHLSANEWLLVLYAASGFISLYTMGKFLVYHFDPIFAVAAYLAGYAFSRLPALLRVRWLSVAVMVVLAAFLVRRLYPFNVLHILRDAERSGQPVLGYCYTHIKTGDEFGYRTETELVNYVRARNPRLIEFASITPALFWRAEIPQASRFTMIHAIGMHRPGKAFTPFQQECRREYLKDLIHKRPELFILSTQPRNLEMFAFEDPATVVRKIPGVDSLLQSSYTLDTMIGPNECYRLK